MSSSGTAIPTHTSHWSCICLLLWNLLCANWSAVHYQRLTHVNGSSFTHPILFQTFMISSTKHKKKMHFNCFCPYNASQHWTRWLSLYDQMSFVLSNVFQTVQRKKVTQVCNYMRVSLHWDPNITVHQNPVIITLHALCPLGAPAISQHQNFTDTRGRLFWIAAVFTGPHVGPQPYLSTRISQKHFGGLFWLGAVCRGLVWGPSRSRHICALVLL